VKTIAVTNQKGGVGKTTTVANLGAALAARGHDVCLIDLDAQSQLTLHLGVDVPAEARTVYDVLTRGADLRSAAVTVRDHLAVVPAEPDLAAAEMELVGTVGREQVLADRLAGADLPYEFVLIDCPPSLGLLTLNALSAADEVLIPLQAHFFGLQGLSGLLETVSLVRQRINTRLRVGGVMFCMFDRRTRLAGEVVSDVAEFLASARGTDAPWAEARIFQTAIRRNVKLAECPSYGKTIFDYEPQSHGAQDYDALADEFLACFSPPAAATEDAPPAPVEEAPAGPAPAAPEPDAMETSDASETSPAYGQARTPEQPDASPVPFAPDHDAAPVDAPSDLPAASPSDLPAPVEPAPASPRDDVHPPAAPEPVEDASVTSAAVETHADELPPSDGGQPPTPSPPWSDSPWPPR